MSGVEMLGYVAGTLTTVAFVPQLVKVWRSRSTHDISLGMFSIFCVGVSLWLAYGISLHAWPVIAANAVTLALAAVILVLKLKYG